MNTKIVNQSIALVLSLLIIMGLVPIAIVSVSADVTDPFNHSEGFFSGGIGTESNPYILSTKTDLDNLAEKVNGTPESNYEDAFNCEGYYFALSNDITEPFSNRIGWYKDAVKVDGVVTENAMDHGFNGVFNGDGKSINLKIEGTDRYWGLFGYLDPKGIIKNVTVTGSVTGLNENCNYYGAVCGYNCGIIESCTNKGIITGANKYCNFYGGICGYTCGGTITNCINDGEVTAVGSYCFYYGGICGKNKNGKIDHCINNKAVTAKNDGCDCFGGLCGYNENGIVSYCENYGDITSTGNFCLTYGGICGRNERASILNCKSFGNVASTGAYCQNYSGICGYDYEGTIDNCWFDSEKCEAKNAVGSYSEINNTSDNNDNKNTKNNKNNKNGKTCVSQDTVPTDSKTIDNKSNGKVKENKGNGKNKK